MTNEFNTIDVERGRHLVRQIGDNKWELGDLAVRVCPATNGDKDGRLVAFAAEIDLPAYTLIKYRGTSAAWPELRTRGRGSWSVYRELAAHRERFEIIAERDHWTVDALRERLDRKPTRYPPPTPEPMDEIDPADPEPTPFDAYWEGHRIEAALDSAEARFRAWLPTVEQADEPEQALAVIQRGLTQRLERFLDLVKLASLERSMK